MSELHDLFLIAHSCTRWWVLAACIATVAYALAAGKAPRAWRGSERRDQLVARVLVASVDVQVLLGMSLYLALSPLARAARQLWADEGLRALWAQPELRFFGLIHPALALCAALLAHAGGVAVQRANTAEQRQRRLAVGAALPLVIFLAAVPWPLLGHERPWFRF
ncbi:MAG: hypothetical protein ABI895_13560 [Deltaproteobacteria bacterium]